jgi:DNA-binding NtrC family response regulator
MINILIVSDEAGNLYSLFESSGFNADTGNESQKTDSYDIAFLDLDVKNWQKKLSELKQQMPVICFARPNVKTAVAAMKLGASDFLEKPLVGDVLSGVINKYKKKLLDDKYGFDKIIGTSSPMQEVFDLIKKSAASESNVLITGESGTGKELVARAIHKWSRRNENLFMTINCSAIPDTLLESELFGFEKGSFTGANYPKKGLLELADGGTIFFDEIGDVTPLFQTKILRVLQEGEIMRIGGTRQTRVDLRIISATNKDIKPAVSKAAFREDLYYRLNVINIHLPPLRAKKEDLPVLAEHFVKKHSVKRKDMLIKGITEDAMNILMRHSYPGNVRELENIIERAISLTNCPEILPSDLPSYLKDSISHKQTGTPKLRDAISTVERKTIISALQESGGNISRAAVLLGIYRQQLQRKIKQLRIAT